MPCEVRAELYDVVDPGRVVAAGREHLRAGVEQFAHRPLAPGPKLPALGWPSHMRSHRFKLRGARHPCHVWPTCGPHDGADTL